MNGAIAIDLNAAGQRRGVNGEVRIDRQRVAQRDGRAGQARVKRDGSVVRDIRDGIAQGTRPGIGVGDDRAGLEFHRADVNLRPHEPGQATLIRGKVIGGGIAARINGGRAGQGRHRLRRPAVIAERGEVGSVGEGSRTGNRAAGVGNRLDEIRAAIG